MSYVSQSAYHVSSSQAGPSRHPSLGLPPPVPSKSIEPSSPSSDAPSPNGWGGNSRHGSMTPSTSGGSEGRAMTEERETSRRNPLVDLIDTEKIYVEQLGLVIRRVAAAWSRKDFPPPKLDAMFRCVEAVYRANRSFGTKLRDIGSNPTSPKALGDLLMRWIDDLEPAYHRYSTVYLTGFDGWALIAKNELLPDILAEISTTSPPPPPHPQWTLDTLFLLPYQRLRYYRRLYARLLRSTKEGRSDHRLLLSANEKLENLTAQCEARLELDVSEEGTESRQVSPTETRNPSNKAASVSSVHSSQAGRTERDRERISRASSGMNSSADSQAGISPFSSRIEDRNSGETTATSVQQSPARLAVKVPTMTPAGPIITTPISDSSHSGGTHAQLNLSDLELRIDPERAIDLFTMTPRACKLQMSPPTLPFTRTFRCSRDVSIFFTPSSTGRQVVHPRAHVFVLSDLFLVAEWMDATDKAAKAQQVAREQPERVGQGGPMPEMWLCYPPLAGKHLQVAEGTQPNTLLVTIMRKETFVVQCETEDDRDRLLRDLMDCVDFATSSTPVTRPPPQPPIQINDPHFPQNLADARSDGTLPPLRYPSPFSPANSSPSVSPRPVEGVPPQTLNGPHLADQMNQLSLQPGETYMFPRGSSPTPPPSQSGHSSDRGSALPPRKTSLRMRNPSLPSGSLAPGMAPGVGLGMPQGFGPGQIMPGSSMPRSPSGRSVQSAPRPRYDSEAPPVPPMRNGAGSHLSEGGQPLYPVYPPNGVPIRSRSADPLRPPIPGGGPPQPPSARFSGFPHSNSDPREVGDDLSPPMSPVEEESATLTGPAVISAQFKCKVFLKQSHQQWKSLGSGRLKLYVQKDRNIKQLVVESEGSKGQMLISTIVLTDGVERVAKTGVAVEISDKGKRTGIIYMIQLRNENSAQGLFESLLVGSDRAVGR